MLWLANSQIVIGYSFFALIFYFLPLFNSSSWLTGPGFSVFPMHSFVSRALHRHSSESHSYHPIHAGIFCYVIGFGYFPSCTMSQLYAAQLWGAAQQQVPDLEKRIAASDLGTLLDWLRQNVHRHGRRYDASELIEKATGRAPGEDCFIKYVKEKYGRIYGISL